MRPKVVAVTVAMVVAWIATSPAGAVDHTGKLQDEGQFELIQPWGVATDEFGNIYVVDSGNHRVVKFSGALEPIVAFGEVGSGPGQLYYPQGIAVGDGKVFVADTSNHRITVFTTDGAPAGTIGEPGGEPGQLAYPQNVHVSDSLLFVSEGGANCRVSIFSTSGAYQSNFGSCGTGNSQFQLPGGIAKLGSEIFVSDQLAGVVKVRTLSGEYVRTIGSRGTGPGQLQAPDGIAAYTAPEGNRIWVVDAGKNSRVSKFTTDGQFLTSFGGTGKVKFGFPHGLTLSQQGVLFVADTSGSDWDVFEFRDLAPKLNVQTNSNLKYLGKTEGLWFELAYNQADKSCEVLGTASVKVPGHKSFKVEEDFQIGSVFSEHKIDVSSKQASSMKKADADKKKVSIDATFKANCSEDVKLTKSVDYKAG